MKNIVAIIFLVFFFAGPAAAEVEKCTDAPGGVVNTCATASYLIADFYWKGQTRSRVGQKYPFATKVILDLYGCSGENCSNFAPKASKTKNISADRTWNFSVDSHAVRGNNHGCAYAVTRVVKVSNGTTVVNSRTPAACQ